MNFTANRIASNQKANCTSLKPFLKSDKIKNNERGFALPSVLFLVTILSLVILSILTLQYFQRKNIQTAAAKIKADYAAQSGISKMFSELKLKSDLPPIGQVIERSYDLGDGEKASVKMEWWGFYLYVYSTGSFRGIKQSRFALAGQIPAGRFKYAMVFSNINHQLVLTGHAHIKGDVLTGPAGVTTGSLANYPTPRIIPIEGNVKRDPKINIQDLDIKRFFDYYDALSSGAISHNAGQTAIQYLKPEEQLHISNEIIKPETKYVFIKGEAQIDGILTRREDPLYIIIEGNAAIGVNAHIDGLVCIASYGIMRVYNTAHTDGIVLYSRKEIIIESNAKISSQVIAPSVIIEPGASISYPSALISYVRKNNNEPQKGIKIENGGQVEGSVVVCVEDIASNDVLLDIEPSAKISGFVISNTIMTFKGSVDGCVQTRDFYFYETPTTYYGWLRSARIDREALSKGALMTVGIDGLSKLQILDWL